MLDKKKTCIMTNTLFAFEENSKPVCHGSPRSLLELAAIKTALNAWLPKFDDYFRANMYFKNFAHIAQLNFHFKGSSAVPVKIEKIINGWMYPVVKELYSWFQYTRTSFRLSNREIYSRFNLVVFGGNGPVNFKDTIANFLEDDSLSIMTRFKIACANCVEEKIDFFWPLVSNELNVDDLRFDYDFMLYYWICRKRGELERIPLKEFSSIERLMIDICRRKFIFLAVEYFLSLLNPDDRLAELYEWMNPDERYWEKISGEDLNCMRLFPNIDGPTQRQILDKYTIHMLYDFVTGSTPIDYAVQCFLYIRNKITPECYYQNVIINLIQFPDSIYGRVSEKETGFRYTRVEIALEQIWLNTPINLKEYALENLSTILDEYSKLHVCCGFGRDIGFLFAVLSDADVQLRNSVWKENWPYWLDVFRFDELMVLCLVKPEGIENFKSTLPYTEEFQDYCDELICCGYFNELDEFLSGLYPNHELVLNIKKHIFTNETNIFSKDNEAIEKYAKYIDKLFSNDELAADFKHDIIFTDEVLKIIFYGDVKFIVSLFGSPKKQSEIKNKFLEMLRDEFTSGFIFNFEKYLERKFLMWCTDNDEQRLDNFMKSMQIDVVFELCFVKCLENYRYDSEFHRCLRGKGIECLNIFLKRYFKSNSMSENYIRERVEYYERMDAADVEKIFGQEKQTVVDFMKDRLLKKYYT